MRNGKATAMSLIALLAFGLGARIVASRAGSLQQPNLAQLEEKFQKEYRAIQALFADGPGRRTYPADPYERVGRWQDELTAAFARAGATVDEILKLHPPDEAIWREQRETMSLYAVPISPPETRTVFGAGEVQRQARLYYSPAADYPEAARAAKAHGEVRLRLVLAADGTVKNIFPMKPMAHGLTEAAIAAARQIKFMPAVRNGEPVSQFETLSYEFKDGQGLPPHRPDHEFYF